jgi:hypothetical protein
MTQRFRKVSMDWTVYTICFWESGILSGKMVHRYLSASYWPRLVRSTRFAHVCVSPFLLEDARGARIGPETMKRSGSAGIVKLGRTDRTCSVIKIGQSENEGSHQDD